MAGENQEFRQGDIVNLTGGGAHMRIEQIDPDTGAVGLRLIRWDSEQASDLEGTTVLDTNLDTLKSLYRLVGDVAINHLHTVV